MPIARLSNRTLVKLDSGGGQGFTTPAEWITTAYGSGWPIAPVTVPQDAALPREIDYPISVNATLTPRTGYGHMPFAALLEAYENVAEVRTPVELLCRELRSFIPHLVDDEGNEIQDHPMAWICDKPDGYTPFGVWVTRLIKTGKVYDAPAVYLDTDSHGEFQGMHYIDGSTLFVIVDESGRVPQPEPVQSYIARRQYQQTSTISKGFDSGWPVGPSTLDALVERLIARLKAGQDIPDKMPAYTQVIKGTPFSWWSADQIWYMPHSPRMNSPYGESFIEIAWPWIMVVVNLTAFELGHYRTGNMPEGFVTVPKGTYASLTELLAQEQLYNSRMSGNPATERMRLRFFPDGTKYLPTKKPDFPDKLYTQSWKNILHAIGVPPSEFGDIPGGGLGGKGFKEGAMSDLSRNALNPTRESVAEPFNHVLDTQGITDARFELAFPTDEIDPDKLKQGVYDGMAHGTLSLNDALGELNLDPVGNPDDHSNIANKHLIVAGSAIYVVEDMQSQNGMAVPTFTGKPGGNTGGTPVGPETAALQSGAEHTPDDHKTVEKVIRNILGTGTLDGKYYSLPTRTVFAEAERLRKGDRRPGVPDDMMQSFLDQGAVESDILGVWRNTQTSQIWVSCGDWAQSQTFDAIRAVCGENVRIEAEVSPPESGEDYIGVSTDDPGEWVAITKVTRPNQLSKENQPVLLPIPPTKTEGAPDHTHPAIESIESNVDIRRTEDTPILPVSPDDNARPAGVSHMAIWYQNGLAQEQKAHPDMPLHELDALVRQNLREQWDYYGREGLTGHIAPMGKNIVYGDLFKHCGVCPEDDEYYGAPISREAQFQWPNGNHANAVEIVAMIPPGLPAKAALWKPEGGEVEALQDWVSGPQYVREEAAYLLDRSLGFYLVPVAYVAEADDEVGAAIYYTFDAGQGLPVEQYAPAWIERAAVFEYITAQQDRHDLGHNYMTHPDDPTRPILIDNGLGFPANEDLYCNSPFCAVMVNRPLSSGVLAAIARCLMDTATWNDIAVLVGTTAANHARTCAQRLLDEKMITDASSAPVTTGSGGL